MKKINQESARRRKGLPRINREREGRKQYIKGKTDTRKGKGDEDFGRRVEEGKERIKRKTGRKRRG